jgi:signal transduction histidine kinase/ActR/RegA family two-component response regulator
MAKKNLIREHRPVLVCMPENENIPVLQSVLTELSADACICPDMPALCRKISDHIDAALIGGDLLTGETKRIIKEALTAQPAWSDLPIIFAVTGGLDSPIATAAVHNLGNVFIMNYPFTVAALKNALITAFRSRDRQRQAWGIAKKYEHALHDSHETRNKMEPRTQDHSSELAERAFQLLRFTGELILSEQKERQKLATILHDHLQQLLVSAKYRVSSLNRTEDPSVKAAAQEVDALLGKVIEISRDLVSDLCPPIVHQGGLRTGMEWLVSFMASKNSLSVQLHMEEDFSRMEENVKILIFDAARELLMNAVRHGQVQSAEHSVGRLPQNMLEVVVTDHGIGFDPSSIKQNGFGLFRIRHRLELIGGRMEIESSPGKGSRFSIYVPLAEPKPPSVQARMQSGASILIREKPVSSTIRILIVDDHAVVRQGLSNTLKQEPDIAIVGEAADGEMALEKTRDLQPDIVLMDLGLPKMTGIEATRLIHSEMPKVRVIGLSMFEEKERAGAMFEAGAVAYLNKTCGVDALTTTIRKCVGRPELAAGNR